MIPDFDMIKIVIIMHDHSILVKKQGLVIYIYVKN